MTGESVERFRERVADSLATDPTDRRGDAHVAVFGVRRLRTDTLATGRRREVRVGGDRAFDLLEVPAVERELQSSFRALMDAGGMAGTRTNQLRRAGDGVVSVRACPSLVRGDGTEVGEDPGGPVPVQPGSVFPFVTELRQPTFAEVLYLLAYLANRDDYRGVYDAGGDRAVRLTPDFENRVAMVVTNWKTSSPSARNLALGIATALASRRTHGEFATGSDGRYDYAAADLQAVVTADRPHGAGTALDALTHAVEGVVPFGAMHGLNDVIGTEIVGPVVDAVTERPRLIVEAVGRE